MEGTKMKKKGLSRREFLQVGAACGLAAFTGSECSRSTEERSKLERLIVDSSLGRQPVDISGSAIGVSRMDPGESYAGTGELLQKWIRDSDQEAWSEIKAKIDYTYENLDLALSPLEAETSFSKEIKSRIKKDQKLLFKPNLVGVAHIDPQTLGPGRASLANTEWAFVAALMRWFHDRLSISYYQMSLGEAATCMPSIASQYSMLSGKSITTEATIEGRSRDFYGGWGFYFARKYLFESLGPDSNDNPMNGYEESVTGLYIPPGETKDKLMVYDLNRISDDHTKGREVEVPGGINYESIILHKAVVGGDPNNRKDRKSYPGCILINVPKFKVHAITLFTNAIKNLGIGLYPMQVAKTGDQHWCYSTPHTSVPGIKSGIPHQVWVPEIDEKTGAPKRDENGAYLVNKTGGINATMIDIIKAVSHQDIFMLHVVDGIETINLDHTGPGQKVSEGMVFAGLDPVATDLLCARYMFSNVPMAEASKVNLDDGTGSRFPQKVPVPSVDGQNIMTDMDYDCPLSRDSSFRQAEERGLGIRKYYVVGRDSLKDSILVSIQGHLGGIKDDTFSDLITGITYFDAPKMPWDLQKTAFGYLKSVDQLTGSAKMKEFLDAFDENGDGVVTYDEFGRKGIYGPPLHFLGKTISLMGTERFGFLHGPFQSTAQRLKLGNPQWNPEGHDILKELSLWATCLVAFQMSQVPDEASDPFLPGLTWGKGKWPSFNLAYSTYIGASLYGDTFPQQIGLSSLYGLAFTYADLTQKEGKFTGGTAGVNETNAIDDYISKIADGSQEPLDFTVYMPPNYDKIASTTVPNVKITSDASLVLTASFSSGKETW